MQLRPYQREMIDNVKTAWKKHRNVMIVLPTGSGKTVVFSKIIQNHKGRRLAIAHRQELIGQISCALAQNGVEHGLLGPSNVVKFVCRLHLERFNRVYYRPNSEVVVAGVDTLLRRRKKDEIKEWLKGVDLWVQDEAHHIQKNNKWGKAVEHCTNAYGLGVTATPLRADGRGLSRDTDGLMDHMIVGPSMRQIIDEGYLTDYRLFAPKSNLDLSKVDVSKVTGDYVRPQLCEAIGKSTIVGDVVYHYCKIACGKLGITFATDVETCSKLALEYNVAGVPAEVVSHKTDDRTRENILRRFKNREILQVCNVDLFGEGFDLPAVEVVSFARPTESYGLYVQQFGRALRLMEGKERAIIIDHVNNVIGRHGLPDKERRWSLGRRERGTTGKKGTPQYRACPQCTGVYERFRVSCPYCGYEPVPMTRSAPEFVDGDLTELDPSVLESLRGRVQYEDRSTEEIRADLLRKGCPEIGVMANIKRHNIKKKKRQSTRDLIALWSGFKQSEGLSLRERYRAFYCRYGTDVLSILIEDPKATDGLRAAIAKDICAMEKNNVS